MADTTESPSSAQEDSPDVTSPKSKSQSPKENGDADTADNAEDDNNAEDNLEDSVKDRKSTAAIDTQPQKKGKGKSAPGAEVAIAPLPADSALGKSILATTFDFNGSKLGPQSAYPVSDERAKLYLSSFEEDPVVTVAAVVCSNQQGALEEIVLLIPDTESAIATASPGLSDDQYTIFEVTDIISYEEMSVSDCVEYRFGPEDTWKLCQTSRLVMERFRAEKFGAFEDMLRKTPIPDLKSLASLLAFGPRTRIYDPFFLNPDREEWKVVNEQNGKVTEVPRPVTEMRIWDCETQSYVDFDTKLIGSPEGEAAKAWFVDVVKHVKTNGGVEKPGQSNTQLSFAKEWGKAVDDHLRALGVKNQWTELVFSLVFSEVLGLS